MGLLSQTRVLDELVEDAGIFRGPERRAASQIRKQEFCRGEGVSLAGYNISRRPQPVWPLNVVT
ncbi:hypothetical protein AB4144_67140, partial [Rhizobiaceae sp. 2RAB30]